MLKKALSANYALVSFSWTDRIRLLRFPDHITTSVVEGIRNGWPKGVQDLKPSDDGLEIKLRGNPFAHGVDEEKIAIRKLVLGILEILAKVGWIVLPVGGMGRIGNYGPHGEKGASVGSFIRFPGPSSVDRSWRCKY
jgi:hypothetical protein